jgi:hypothetical protein
LAVASGSSAARAAPREELRFGWDRRGRRSDARRPWGEGKEVRAVAAFLFVTASVAVVMGLVGLVAGHWPRTTGRRHDPADARRS